MYFVKFNDVKRRFMSELYIFIYELCALINENLKKNFYFQAGLFLVVVFLGFFSVLASGLVKFGEKLL